MTRVTCARDLGREDEKAGAPFRERAEVIRIVRARSGDLSKLYYGEGGAIYGAYFGGRMTALSEAFLEGV